MILIIEGPDGSGKSTLAAKLSKQTGYPVVHRSQPKNEEERQQMMQMYLDAVKSSDNVIFDRCWYSEMVYGSVMRDKSYIDDKQMLYLETALAEKGAMIIHCTDYVEILWRRCSARGEDYIKSIETLASIKDSFDYTMNNLPHIIPVVTYRLSDCHV